MTSPTTPADAHRTHDRVLVAAFVAGDLEGPEAEAARALVATCDECAELAADLAAMTSAIRDLPAPVRSRDFRITSELASAVDRRGIRRFLPRGRDGLGFARPLGSGLAALGVAGLLFTSLAGSHPAMILSNVGSAVGGAAGAPGYAASLVPEAAATNRTDAASKGGAAAASAAASAAAMPSAAASAAAMASAADSAGPTAAPTAGASAGAARDLASIPPVPPPTEPSSTSVAPALPPSTAQPPTAGPPGATSAPGAGTPSQGEVPLLPAASIVALLAGLGLLGADVLVRRR